MSAAFAAALAAAEELPEAPQVQARLVHELGEQLQKMEQVRNQLQEAGEGEGGEGAMLRVMTQTQEQLGDNQGPLEGDQEPLQEEQDRERLQENQGIGEPGETGIQNQQHEQFQEQLQNQQDVEQQQSQEQNQDQNHGEGSQSEDSPPASPGGNGQQE